MHAVSQGTETSEQLLSHAGHTFPKPCTFLHFWKNINWNCNFMFFHAERNTWAHTLKMKRRKLNQYSGQCDSHFLKKQFPRCINATYHQAINSPNLKEIMLDYKKRGCAIYNTAEFSSTTDSHARCNWHSLDLKCKEKKYYPWIWVLIF